MPAHLLVAATGADRAHALRPQLGHRRRAAHLELALLLVDAALACNEHRHEVASGNKHGGGSFTRLPTERPEKHGERVSILNSFMCTEKCPKQSRIHYVQNEWKFQTKLNTLVR